MKTKLLLASLVVFVMFSGFDCIYDPITVTIDATPLTGCFKVNPGSGSFNDSTGAIVISSLIPSDYRDKVKALRFYDIVVRVTHPHPNGIVTGSVYYRFTGQAAFKLLDFRGEYETFSQGVSVLNSGGLITFNTVGLTNLVNLLSNVNAVLGQTVVLRGQGSGPAVTQLFNVCADIYLQVDGETSAD